MNTTTHMEKTVRPSTILQLSIIILLTALFIYTTNINFKTLQNDIDSIFTFNYIISILCNLLLLYLIYFFLRIRLVIRINEAVISYKLLPLHLKLKKIKKADIKSIRITDIYFHMGTVLTNNTNYAIGNGYCLSIESTNGKKYLLSTGFNKHRLLEVLKQYGYVNRIAYKHILNNS